MPSRIRIDARFQTTSFSQDESVPWQENTVVLLHKKAGTLIHVYAGDTLLGQGQLVAHQGKYAIRLVKVY